MIRAFYTDLQDTELQRIIIKAFEDLRQQGIEVNEYHDLEEYFEIPESGLPRPKRPKKS